ncbi:hypothetical protein Tco_0219154 [Tanacetum coccineum]
MYDSWASRIRLFIKGKKHGRMMLDSINNGPLDYPTIEENGQTRPKKYSELTEAQQLQDDCDVQATNIIIHGVPPDVYALVNYQEAAKDIWDRGETLYEYYWRFSQLINDMHTIGMIMQQVQVNTKFLNSLPSEWSKFVTDVKLAKSLYTTNYDQLYAYLSQQERHANEVCITRERYPDPLALQGEDPIECINKAMTFLSAVASRLPPSNNQLRMSSNPKHQETIQDDRVIVQQCTHPKRPRNAALFKEKLMLAEAQEAGQILDEEQLAFLADPDLDAHDSNYDDLSSAKAVMMANLSSCDSNVLFEESQDVVIQDTNSSAPNDLLVLTFVIAKEHAVISVIDDEETLILEEESRSKMLDKQNDPISIETRIKISPIDYSKLNKIKEDFSKRFVTKKELSVEQAFWLKHSSFSETPVTSHTPVRIETHSELPKVILVNESLKKLKYQLANFDKVVKKRTTSDAITAGAWGFEHTKACFVTEIIPFLKVLKDTSNAFDKTLLDKIIKVQTIFNQMEAAIDQCSVDKNVFEIQIKQLSIDNDQLLKQILSQEIMHIAVNSVDILDVKKSCVNECNKCLELETKLLKKKDLIEKDVYNKLLKSYSTLEKHFISLELTTQLNQEVFQKNNFCENQNAHTFSQLLELNKLKAQSQEKDTVIRKLKDMIKSLSGKDSVENVKKDIDEIETINIELDHSVAQLLFENENLRKEREHLKSIYKDHFESIRKTSVQSKEHYDSLIAQINAKLVENLDLNAQLQGKVFAIASLKNELRKLKGKNVVDTVVSKPSATNAPRMFKLDIEPISHRLKNNRDAHEVYL